MTDQEVAADHLKIIRSLMERATVYRAISAPAALFGGIVAMLVGLRMAFAVRLTPPPPTLSGYSLPYIQIDPQKFFLTWVGVLAVVGAFNTFLLWRGSQNRDGAFVSSGMKLALRATTPPMLAGGVVSFVVLETVGSRSLCALLWVVFYSLALLSTRSFAPRSMRWLGWMFFCAGLGLFVLQQYFSHHLTGKFSTDQAQAGLIMALTFGALHVVYACIILCRKPKGEEGI